MIKICCNCKKYLGEKEPLENKSITHGYCPECLAVAMDEIKNTRILRPSHSDAKVSGHSHNRITA